MLLVHVVGFGLFCQKALWTNALAVLLSIFRGAGGCLCPGTCRSQGRCMMLCQLWNRSPVFASAADATTDCSVLHSNRMGAFGADCGIVRAGSG